ncbi:MAG: MarR family winged helix-turn-helix transcriptional regulator [Bacillota bacterium]
MQQLVEMILSGQLRLPLLPPDLLELDRELPKTDLLALLMLHRRGEATMTELAEDLNVPLSTATGIGARLTKRRLIERQRSEEDRRVIVNRLTEEGRALAVKVQGQIDALLERVTTALTPEELSILMTLVQKVLRAFQEERPAAPSAREATSRPRRIPLDN